MKKYELLDRLMTLARVEMDASRCYGQAVRNVSPAVRKKLDRFLVQHDEHLDAVTGLIEKMGQMAPVSLPENQSLFNAGMRPVTESERELETLEDMLANERFLYMMYQQQQSPALTSEESKLIDRNLQDEEAHVRYLEEAVRERSGHAPARGAGASHAGQAHR